MCSRFVRANGINLHCLDHPGGEPTVVLLPGLTAGAAIFEGLIAAGLSPRFRAISLDLRGRGLSDAPAAGAGPSPASGYTMADHAADVVGLLDVLAVPNPVLIGHSFGGMLALYLAARHPDRFPRVVVLDWAVALVTPATRELLRPIVDRLGVTAPSLDDYLASVRRMPVFRDGWDPAIDEYYRSEVRVNPDGSVQPRARPDAIGAAIEGTLIEDWPAVVARVRQPVLLINATGPFGPPGAPPFLSPDAAQATAASLPNGRHVAVAGHHITMIFGEGARQVVAAVTAFLRDEDGVDRGTGGRT